MKKKTTSESARRKPTWTAPTIEVMSIKKDTKHGVSNGNDGGGGKTGS